jgi:hypothetical protein
LTGYAPQMERANSFETLVTTYQTTLRHIPEDSNLQTSFPYIFKGPCRRGVKERMWIFSVGCPLLWMAASISHWRRFRNSPLDRLVCMGLCCFHRVIWRQSCSGCRSQSAEVLVCLACGIGSHRCLVCSHSFESGMIIWVETEQIANGRDPYFRTACKDWLVSFAVW